VTASAIDLNATTVTTSGNQTYAGAVTLGANTNFTGSNLITTSGSTVNGSGFSMNVTGNDFIGGNITNVNALTVSGTTALNANVSTIGSQTSDRRHDIGNQRQHQCKRGQCCACWPAPWMAMSRVYAI
jgi:hypothetical protein